MDRFEEVAIGKLAAGDLGGRLTLPEKASECRQRQFRAAGVKLFKNQCQPAPEVGMLRASAPLSQAAQAGDRVKAAVKLARDDTRFRLEEQPAILCDKKEQDAVDDTEQLAVVVLRIERGG